jgi:hypothetical protein
MSEPLGIVGLKNCGRYSTAGSIRETLIWQTEGKVQSPLHTAAIVQTITRYPQRINFYAPTWWAGHVRKDFVTRGHYIAPRSGGL